MIGQHPPAQHTPAHLKMRTERETEMKATMTALLELLAPSAISEPLLRTRGERPISDGFSADEDGAGRD